MVSIDFLKKVEMLKAFDTEQLSKIMDCCSQQDFQEGERLFAEKEEALHVWILEEGLVDLRFDLPGRPTTTDNTITTISDSMCVGWSGLVPPYKYTLSAYCTSRKARVVKLETQCLKKVFKEDPRVGYLFLSYLIRIIGSRFQLLQNSHSVTPFPGTKVIVHMGTCGIAAGARSVMSALMDELAGGDYGHNIQVESGGCMGKCDSEPNVSVQKGGDTPVVYCKMDPDKIKRVAREHLLGGRIVKDYV